jgi:hypothetical protein
MFRFRTIKTLSGCAISLLVFLIACQGMPALVGSSAVSHTVKEAETFVAVIPSLAPTSLPATPTRVGAAAPSRSATSVPAAPTLVGVLFPTLAAFPSNCRVRGPLPDPKCTPGAIDPRVTQNNLKDTICKKGYTSTVRPPVSVTEPLKVKLLKAYGLTGKLSDYELDHLVPLELGSSSDVANLFPEAAEPRPGFHEKDKVENYLNAQVCQGKMLLAEAQRQIATDWVAVYNAMPASER